MKLQYRSRKPSPPWQVLQCPALTNPISHQCSDRQGSRNWCALEIFRFSRLVFGYIGNCDIEACETGKTAEDEEGQEDVVNRGTKANGECSSGWGDTEGDLLNSC